MYCVGAACDDGLEMKAEKYESKTAQCKEWARQATDDHQRNFYEELDG
jgi:hypothetical protein